MKKVDGAAHLLRERLEGWVKGKGCLQVESYCAKKSLEG